MKENKIVKFASKEELSRAFADEVARNYFDHLLFWQSTAMDSPSEYEYWQRMMDDRVNIVRFNAFMTTLDILKDVANNMQYAKGNIYKSRRLISITSTSGFYDHLLKGAEHLEDYDEAESIRYAVAVNVEYILNRRAFTMVKKIYSDTVRL